MRVPGSWFCHGVTPLTAFISGQIHGHFPQHNITCLPGKQKSTNSPIFQVQQQGQRSKWLWFGWSGRVAPGDTNQETITMSAQHVRAIHHRELARLGGYRNTIAIHQWVGCAVCANGIYALWKDSVILTGVALGWGERHEEKSNIATADTLVPSGTKASAATILD